MQTSGDYYNLLFSASVENRCVTNETSLYFDHYPFLQLPKWEENDHEGEFRYRHIVNHDYHDYGAVIDSGNDFVRTRGGILSPFPLKLHAILDAIEQDGYDKVISWQPHGRCFIIHKPKDFVEYVMPKYFNHTKISSFQRQLNLYGFQRLTRGPDKGGYYNELFLRGKVFLARRIKRMRIKGTGVRARSNPNAEPNFLNMPPMISRSQDSVKPLPPQPCLTTSQFKGFKEMGDVSKGVQVDALAKFISQELRSDSAEFGGKQFFPLHDHEIVKHLPNLENVASATLTPNENQGFAYNFESHIFNDINSDEEFAQLMEYLIQ
jgi:HSF-type DNA-binding